MHPSLQRVVAEWQSNQRLRLAVMLGCVILLVNLASLLQSRIEANEQAYQRDARLERSLSGLAGQSGWEDRAKQAEQALTDFKKGLATVSQPGLARAEMQMWLETLARESMLGSPVIRVEDAIEVTDHPGVLQVVARLDGSIPAFGHKVLMDALADGLPWVQVERIELADAAGSKVSLVLRGHYLHRNDAVVDHDMESTL